MTGLPVKNGIRRSMAPVADDAGSDPSQCRDGSLSALALHLWNRTRLRAFSCDQEEEA